MMNNKRKFNWTKIKQYAFEKINWIVDRNILLTYPDINELFKIHTDASKFQLRVVIINKVKPIAFHSRKLTDDQKRYTVTESDF